MKSFRFTSSQWLPRKLDELFPFFANARNLEQLTPPWLRFSVLTPEPIPMRAGTQIDYRLRWRGIPLRWRSEIERWDPPHSFVDRQIKGPYRLWHHEHLFSERDGGTLIEDRVDYAVWFGVIAQRLMVRRDVEAIFAFRHKRLEELFLKNIDKY
jgi:ligand-binding SRPBCC domain-containing protein